MSARPNIFARIQLWLKRFRHRCGYGIHSPYAFNLVTQVIYQRGEYYAYASLAAAREGAHLCEKDDRLLLRLANDWRPRTCWLIGPETDVSAAYLRAGCEACTLRQMRSLEEVAAAGEPAEMIVVDDDAMGPRSRRCARAKAADRPPLARRPSRRRKYKNGSGMAKNFRPKFGDAVGNIGGRKLVTCHLSLVT